MNTKRESIPFDKNRPEQHVDDFVHELLSEEQAAIVESWCAGSDEGKRALDDARQRMELLSSIGTEKAGKELVSATMSRIEGRVERRARRWRTYRLGLLYSTAASILLIASVQWYYSGLKATPYDLRIVGQNEWIAGSDGSLQIFVQDTRSVELLRDVPLEISLRSKSDGTRVQLASYQTGGKIPQFEIPDWAAGDYELTVTADIRGSRESITKEITLRRPWRLLLTSDKPMYQPGQTIHLRCQGLRRPQLKPVAGDEVTFRLFDPKGNVVFRHDTETSPFGIASADCQLADDIILGDYIVECQVGTTRSSRTLKVDRYVLPKIQASLRFDQSFYKPGDVVTVDVDASYVFGKPITSGTAKLFLEADGLNVDITDPIEIALDDEGKAKFEVPLPDSLVGRPQEGGQTRIRAVVRVADSVGQDLVIAGSRVVTQRPILVEIVPESPYLLVGSENIVYVMTQYADGRPAETELLINGSESTVMTNAFGIAQIKLTPDSANVGLTVTARDTEGAVGRANKQLSASSGEFAFLARLDRAVYDSGETIVFEAIGGGAEPIFVDLVKDDQTIASYVVPMNDGSGSLDIDIPLDVFGTIRLESYRLGQNGFARRQSRVVMVRQADALVIDTTFDRSEYRPGETAEIEFRLRDEDGTPRPGAIGLSVVDEALFSLLQSASGMERAFFMLEEELLEPVYAIYGSWDPFDEDDVEERRLLEQALFAHTTYTADSRDAVKFERERSSSISGQNSRGNTFTEPSTGRVIEVKHRNPFSLAVGNYKDKVKSTARQKKMGLEGCRTAWGVLGVSVVLALIVGFAFAFPRTFAVCAALFSLLGMCGGVLFVMTAFVAEQARFGGADSATAENSMDWEDSAGSDGSAEMPDAAMNSDGGKEVAPRVRDQFPETLYWNPEIITNDEGIARITLPLADSITTWRMTLNAVDGGGRLGAAENEFLVFQPFQVDIDAPVKLTRGDEIEMPIVVYNYTDQVQSVRLEVEEAEWFDSIDGSSQLGDLVVQPGEVASSSFRMTARKVGRHEFTVSALGESAQDAIRRVIEVVPDGRRVEQTVSGRLVKPFDWEVEVPTDAIEGSVSAKVRFYPTSFSQLVEGLDTIFQRPYGCFEQTSSTTYPNILALRYLQENELSVPQVEAKARQYIHIGYQRLLSFEVGGGGFDWYGQAPASIPLTAYGLLEFKDMAIVHNVDPRLIRRTERWLMSKRQADGSWQLDRRQAGFVELAGSDEEARLVITASVAWAVFLGRSESSDGEVTKDFLLSHAPNEINDPYVLAMVIHALNAIDPKTPEIRDYAAQLEALHQIEESSGYVFWRRGDDVHNLTYSRGRSAEVEVTSLATTALYEVGMGARIAPAALEWIIAQKDPQGTWHSTQATVLALKALIAGTNAKTDAGVERTLVVTVNGMQAQRLVVPASQSEVVQSMDLSGPMSMAGPHSVSIREESDTAMAFQLDLAFHVPDEDVTPAESAPLAINVNYGKDSLAVDETVVVDVVVENLTDNIAPMVMVDLPIPAGFAIDSSSLEDAVNEGRIGKYQLTPTQIIVYLRQLAPNEPLELQYELRAKMPVKILVPASEVYEYYDPDRRARTQGRQISVNPA